MHNTVISDSTDNTLPIDSGGSMTPLDLTNNVTPVDSVNNDSVAPQPTEAPSFLGKNSFFLNSSPQNIMVTIEVECILEVCFCFCFCKYALVIIDVLKY